MFRTHSQLPGSSHSRPICVHEYTRTQEEESSSDSDLIRAGHAAAGHDTHWITVALANPPARRKAVSITYELAGRPPDSTERVRYTLKDWDTDFDDALNLDELEDFESTDLKFLLATVKRAYEEEDGPPSKRRKLDVASLRDIISQPHILPSILFSCVKKPDAIWEYSKTAPIPIAPHTLPLPAPPPYSRRSWVIPVRGTPPWKHTTSAAVLLDSTALPEPPDPKNPNEITWTAPALSALWTFLRALREGNSIGPMGLSFHISPYYQSNSQKTYTEVSGMGAQPQSVSDDPGAVSLASSARRLTVPLTLVDHIKVYHEATDSMRFRTILDAWRFEVEGNKIRPLKGARLALLDERSRGVLVS
ncbi:hypothetical protein FB45DRAFT_1079785 [Roridomyces roridus]|uniref:Uncharacterized protein n=1 Tax=Roridomyces roridus TaxID=1738132 RepID=A0AAD7FMG0_9AGAR|nr:hypothetical protein FB45DRAFT_1079785 [Roridomyces roridus]